jgi:hypothetical protein
MHQEQPKTFFLNRYESTLGLWVQTPLDGEVSCPLQEAMNCILEKDGTLAFIGTKSEFGQFLAKLRQDRAMTSKDFWTSLPEASILATLGLSVNTSTSGRRSLVFYGSPRTLMLGHIIDTRDLIDWPARLCGLLERHDKYEIEFSHLGTLGVIRSSVVYPNELQSSFNDYLAWLNTKEKKEELQEASQLVGNPGDSSLNSDEES